MLGFGFFQTSSSPSLIREKQQVEAHPSALLGPSSPMAWLSSAPGSLGNTVETIHTILIHNCFSAIPDTCLHPSMLPLKASGRDPWWSCFSLVNPSYRYCENHCCSPKVRKVSAGEQGSLLELLLQMVHGLPHEVLVSITPGTAGNCCPGLLVPWNWEPVSRTPLCPEPIPIGFVSLQSKVLWERQPVAPCSSSTLSIQHFADLQLLSTRSSHLLKGDDFRFDESDLSCPN